MFLENNRDLDEARVKLLIDLDRILEAAGVHAQNDKLLKAVEILTAPATYSVDHVRPTIEYLLTGLRRSFTLGILPASSPIASKLLARTGRLEKSAMTTQEVDEVIPSRPLDRRVLHPSL